MAGLAPEPADSPLSLADLTGARATLPLSADLLRVRSGGSGPAWRSRGRLARDPAHRSLPSLGRLRFRSGARAAGPGPARSRAAGQSADRGFDDLATEGGQGGHARAAQSDLGDRPVRDDHPGLPVFLRAAAGQGKPAAAGPAHRADHASDLRRACARRNGDPGATGCGDLRRRDRAGRSDAHRDSRQHAADLDRERPPARLARPDRWADR